MLAVEVKGQGKLRSLLFNLQKHLIYVTV